VEAGLAPVAAAGPAAGGRDAVAVRTGDGRDVAPGVAVPPVPVLAVTVPPVTALDAAGPPAPALAGLGPAGPPPRLAQPAANVTAATAAAVARARARLGRRLPWPAFPWLVLLTGVLPLLLALVPETPGQPADNGNAG
jgi:hypothetical protein